MNERLLIEPDINDRPSGPDDPGLEARFRDVLAKNGLGIAATHAFGVSLMETVELPEGCPTTPLATRTTGTNDTDDAGKNTIDSDEGGY